MDKVKVGKYLRKLVEKKYDKARAFGRAYLQKLGMEADDVALRRMSNRLTQIFQGKKGIPTDDVLVFADMLGVSCEEILSAGERKVPTSSHMTNYDIAFSKEKEKWEMYMKRDDKLFLNSDEYGKTVIDYAIEFKNYAFIKYLMDEEYIWLVDNSEYHQFGYSYGGGTSIEKRAPWDMDNAVPLQVQYDDQLRTQIIALALENEDYDVLDKLRAREIPFLYQKTSFSRGDKYKFYNEELVRMISAAPEKILDYFSQEFEVENVQKWRNPFIYPFIGDVIDIMVEEKEEKKVEFLAQRVLKHNQNTYEKVFSMLEDAYEVELKNQKDWAEQWKERDPKIYETIRNHLKTGVLNYFNYDENNQVVSFFYSKENKKQLEYFLTDIVKVSEKKVPGPMNELLLEINMWYERIAKLKETWGCE